MAGNSSSCAHQFVALEASCEQGLCNSSTGGCICFHGWSNVGDFSFNNQGACDLYENAIVGLWITNLTVVSISLFYAFLVLVKRKRLGIMLDQKTWRVGIVPFSLVFACAVSISFAVIKLFDLFGNNVGEHIALTILSGLFISLIAIGLFCGLLVFMKTSMNLLPSQSEHLFHLQKSFLVLEKVSTIIAVVGITLTWMPIMMLFDKGLTQLSAKLLGVGLGSVMLLVGSGIASVFIGRLIEGIADTLRSAKEMGRTDSASYRQLSKLYLKLRVARFFQLFGFLVASVIIFTFCFTPFLVKKASYLYPMAFMAGVMAIDILMWSQNNMSSTRKASSMADKTPTDPNSAGAKRRKTGWTRLSLKTAEM